MQAGKELRPAALSQQPNSDRNSSLSVAGPGSVPQPHTIMRKLIEIRIEEDGDIVFHSDYKPLKGMNLYQQVFLTLLFECNQRAVGRWMEAVRILALADVLASKRPEVSMNMFEHIMDDLSATCERLKSHLGGNLNFKLAAV